MGNDVKINIESLLYGYYIKYEKMYEFCMSPAFKDFNANSIDVYIDIYDMLSALYTKDVYTTANYTITSSVINIAAFIRGYFWSRHRLTTRIYLVYAKDNTVAHRQFVQDFGSTDYTMTMNYAKMHDVINGQLELVKILCAHIDDIYFISRDCDFVTFCYHNIIQTNPMAYNILITKNKYAYLIPSMIKRAIIWRPKKYNGEDKSYQITNDNVILSFFKNINMDKAIDNLSRLSPELLSLLIAMTGLPSHNLRTVMNGSVAARLLCDAIDNNRLINNYNSDTDYIYDQLTGINKYIDPMSLKYRFQCVDLVFQNRVYNMSAESRDMTWYINLHDPNTVKDINNKYFVNNPLDLNNL